MNNLFKTLPASVRQTFLASFPLIIVVILFLIVGRVGFSKFTEVRNQIDVAKKTVNVLNQKLDVLKTISKTAESSVNMVSQAVPNSNPTLVVTSQLKNLALANSVIASSFKSSAGSVGTGGLSQTVITFTVDGTRTQVFNFLSAIPTFAPITIVDKIRLTESAGVTRADVSVKSFWAELPKTIPKVDSPISDLTAKEKETLTSILSLNQPTLSNVGTSPQEGTNPNPFGQ